MSRDRAYSLIKNLPRESRFIRKINGEASEWGWTEHLLANIFDALQVQIWQTSMINSKHKPKRPTPIERPGTKKKSIENLDIGKLVSLKDRTNGRR